MNILPYYLWINGGNFFMKEKNRKPIIIETMEQPSTKAVEKWWIPDLLPKYRLTLLTAMGGTGKTSFAAYLSKRLSLNHGARIAYWSFEDTPQDFTNKIGKLDLVWFIHEQNDSPIDLTYTEHYNTISKFLYDHGIDILVVDPISALLSGDTNDNQKVRAMLNPLLRMADDLALTILGIHHFRKPSRAGMLNPRSSVMGASAWVDCSRHVLALVKNDHNQRFLEVTKSNVGETGKSWEVFSEVNKWKAFVITDMVKTDDFAATRALEDPDNDRMSQVIKNLREKFAIGQPFNLDDVDAAGNRKSFYNWCEAHKECTQVCKNKKNGKKAYIFVR